MTQMNNRNGMNFVDYARIDKKITIIFFIPIEIFAHT